jgi:hypothetical protein
MKLRQTSRQKDSSSDWLEQGKEAAQAASDVYPRREMEQARLRVGDEGDYAKRLRWLLQLAQWPRPALMELAGRRSSPLSYDLHWLFGSYRPEDVVAAADALDRGIRSLLAADRWEIDIPAGTRCVLTIETSRPKDRRQVAGRLNSYFRAPDLSTTLLLLARDVLKVEWRRIQKCPAEGCPRLFIKNKRAQFCPDHRSQAERARRWRGKQTKKDLSDLRHRQYVRRLAKKRGVKEKSAAKMVSRRPRIGQEVKS